MKCEKIFYAGKQICVLTDDSGKLVPEVNRYLHSVFSHHSVWTERSYAYRLLLFYRYLKFIGKDAADIWNDRHRSAIDYLSDFIVWLRFPETLNKKILYHFAPGKPLRTEKTVNQIIDTVLHFFEYLFRNVNNKQFENLFYYAYRNKQYRSFLSEMGYLKLEKKMNILKLKEPEKEIKYITKDEYKKLLEAATTLRDKVLLGLMYELGIRLGEALGLHISDLKNLHKRALDVVYRGDNVNDVYVKYHSERTLGVKPYLAAWIVQLICEQEKYKSDYVFLASRGEREGLPLLENSAQRTLKNIGIRAGLPGFHAHLCRHGYAMRKLNDEDEPLERLSQSMGHKHIESTRIYAKYSDRKIIDVMSRQSDNEKIELPEVLKWK